MNPPLRSPRTGSLAIVAAIFLAVLLAAAAFLLWGVSSQQPENFAVPTATLPTSPARQPRLAPKGVLYVTKRFSVSTAKGLYGFSQGKKVSFIREEMGQYIVSDDTMEGKAPKNSFTNDLDVVDALLENLHQRYKRDVNARIVEPQIEVTDKESDISRKVAIDIETRNNELRLNEVASLKRRLADVKKRISEAKRQRSSIHYGDYQSSYISRNYNNGSYYSPHIHSGRSLSTDATQIEKLLELESQLESQINSIGQR